MPKHVERSVGCSRRNVLRLGLTAAASVWATPLWGGSASEPESNLDEESQTGEAFWSRVADEYDVLREPMNLIAGSNNPSPLRVLRALQEHQRHINPSPLARGRGPAVSRKKDALREQLAQLAGASAEELALVRGATEGLNNVIFGLPLQRGDEILTTRHDYPSIKDALQQRAKRDGLKVKEVDWSLPIEDPSVFADQLMRHVTPRTRAILICHVYGGYGQIAPIRLVSERARERGIEVIVDGALAFGNIPVDLHELGCDYYATSLHKWLGAPLGTGLLYVRREKISALTPLFGVPDHMSDDIRKFEDVGTTSPAPILAAQAAVDLFSEIGPNRKSTRLQMLKMHWSNALAEVTDVSFLVRREPRFSGASLSFALPGIPPRELWLYLLQKRGINIGIHPYRQRAGFVQTNYIAPNVFTSLSDLDRAVSELAKVAAHGTPA